MFSREKDPRRRGTGPPSSGGYSLATSFFHVVLGLIAGFGVGIILMIVAKTVITLELEAQAVHPTAAATELRIATTQPVDASAATLHNLLETDKAAIRKEIDAKPATVMLDRNGVKNGVLHLRDAHPWPKTGEAVHVLFTSNGSPYLNFQSRIMYATFKLAQQMPGGDKLVAMTRILHRTRPDELMDEIPTFRADPIQPKCDQWCEFPVSDRPNAVNQFFAAARKDPSMIKAPWLLLIEGDYVWAKPIRAPKAESADPSWAFPFSYINPEWPGLKGVIRKMYPEERGPVKDIPHSGPAPVLMRNYELEAVTPEWERLAAHIENDAESKKKLGWVREMYAFSIGAALLNIPLSLVLPPNSPLIAQPPADHVLGDAAMYHYTWGAIFKDVKQGAKVWEWEKRVYTAPEVALKVPTFPMPPEWREGLVLQDGVKVTKELVETYKHFISTINRGVEMLPDLTKYR